MPVLYAVFMYMGVSALRNMQVCCIEFSYYICSNLFINIQIFDRVLLILMPQKHQPDHPYLRHVRITRVHLFTAVQLISLGGMFAVKSVKSIAIGFPVLVSLPLQESKHFSSFSTQVLATCFVRKLMDMIFTQEELFWLDDILPGTKIGRIRRLSAPRNVHIPRSDDHNDEAKKTVNQFSFFPFFDFLNKNQYQQNHFQPPLDRLDTDPYRDMIENNLRSIAEVGLYIKLHAINSKKDLISHCFKAPYIDFDFHLDYK